MTLPDTFKFVADDGIYVYEANLLANFTYEVTWKEDNRVKAVPYTCLEASTYIRTGDWKIVPESFTDISEAAGTLGILVSEKKDAGELSYEELKALKLTRGLINRLLDDRQ